MKGNKEHHSKGQSQHVKADAEEPALRFTPGIFLVLHKNAEAVDRADYPQFYNASSERRD